MRGAFNRIGFIALLLCLSPVRAGAARAGTAADAVFRACGSAENQIQVFECAQRRLDAIERRHSETYAAALERGRIYTMQQVRDAGASGGLLRESQRRWIAFRDAECAMQADAHSAGGSAHHEGIFTCLIDMVSARIDELEQLYR